MIPAPCLAGTAALLAATVLGAAACGAGVTSAGGAPGPGTSSREGGTATLLMGSSPDYLDPQEGYTTQAAEADWITYTPLLTYRHASGAAGTQLIPGLADALPAISRDGTTYTLTLRRGLAFSNGRPVTAGDFAYTIERAIKLNWGGKSFFTTYIAGAAAYDAGEGRSISGIRTDDATGRITITLNRPYGAFANVLALPATGIVPSGTSMTNLSNDPPPGVGPYMITSVQPNRGFTMVKNPEWPNEHLTALPAGHLDRLVVQMTSNPQSEAEQVLDGQADALDAADMLPPALVPQIERRAKDRFAREPVPSTFYFFLNTREKPFDDPLAREAVNIAVDRRALQRLAGGFLQRGCSFLPQGIAGHPAGPCAFGSTDQPPDLARARALVRQAGLTGTPVTVWGASRSAGSAEAEYYASVLNQIGFKATPKIIAASIYSQTIGSARTHAQTGLADWLQDFPNPSDFYLLLDAASIQPTNNENFGYVDDPHVQAELAKLDAVPATKLATVAGEWQALDRYVESKAYAVVFGSERLPLFLGPRLDFGAAIFHPLFLNDWTSWRLR